MGHAQMTQATSYLSPLGHLQRGLDSTAPSVGKWGAPKGLFIALSWGLWGGVCRKG